MPTPWLLLAVLALAAPAAAADPSLPPTRTRPLERWLEAGEWRSTWVPEPAAHPSLGAHGRSVRTWYSPALVEDLAAGRVPFRRGAAIVKELFDPTGTTLLGFAVMRKVRARSGARGTGWFFWETADPRPFRGRGLPVCASCHARGVDFLLSAFRP
jgi:hypothetical protein